MGFQLTENDFHVLEQNLEFIKWYFYTLSSGVANDKMFCVRNLVAPQESLTSRYKRMNGFTPLLPQCLDTIC